MPFLITIVVAVFSVLALGICAWDFARGNKRRGAVSAIGLVVFLIALNLTTGFPFPNSGRISFGGGISTVWGIVVMFAGIVLGCIAQGIWNAKENNSWINFARPIVISPILLLPLLASLPSDGLEPIQLVGVTILAFQNGFFWQQVLKDAKPITGGNPPPAAGT